MLWGQFVHPLLFAVAVSFFPPSSATHGEEKSVIISELSVPKVAKAGDNVNLSCEFELLGTKHKLYTVNWWRGKDQFYSYKENTYQPINAYKFKGITVNVQKSTQNLVVLEKINEETTGDYKCEVMGEGPAFKTAVGTKFMRVIVPPEKIEISHEMSQDSSYQYQPNDDVQLNCTAHGVKPRPLLIWKINGREVQNDHAIRYPDFENHRGRVTSTSRLQFKASLFNVEREAVISCVALVEGEEFVTEEIIRLHPSAAFDLYSSCGWKSSVAWKIVGLLLFVGYSWNL